MRFEILDSGIGIWPNKGPLVVKVQWFTNFNRLGVRVSLKTAYSRSEELNISFGGVDVFAFVYRLQ